MDTQLAKPEAHVPANLASNGQKRKSMTFRVFYDPQTGGTFTSYEDDLSDLGGYYLKVALEELAWRNTEKSSQNGRSSNGNGSGTS
jgi:hypothetical protein